MYLKFQTTRKNVFGSSDEQQFESLFRNRTILKSHNICQNFQLLYANIKFIYLQEETWFII